MPLAKNIVPVIFQGGLDQKTAKQLTIPGKFLVLENCVRRKLGRIEKRFGFIDLGTGVIGGTDINSGIRLAKLDNDLVLLTRDKIYSRSEANDDWIDKGDVVSTTVTSSAILHNTLTQSQPDIASTNGITVSAWESWNGTATEIRCSVFDETSNSVLVYNDLLHTTASRPKVTAIEGAFLITYLVGTGIKFVRVDASNPTQFYAEDDLIASTNVKADRPYDIRVEVSKAILAYASAAGQLTIAKVNKAGEVGNGVNGMPTPITVGSAGDFDNLSAVGITPDQTNNLIYVFHSDGSTIDWTVMNSAFLSVSTQELDGSDSATNITGAVKSSGIVSVFIEGNFNPPTVFVCAVQNTTLVAGPSMTAFLSKVGLASKAVIAGDEAFAMVAYESALQSTFFVIRDDLKIVAKMAQGVGGGYTRAADASRTRQSGLPNFEEVDGEFFTARPIATKFEADSGGSVVGTYYGIQRFNIIFDSPTFYNDQLGQNLHIGSGVVGAYDGVSITELGFHIYPETVTFSSQATTGGSISPGTYRIAAVYEWIDAQGQVHQSAPSTKLSVTVPAGTNTNKINLTVPALTLTDKIDARGDVNIVLYRSLAGGVDVLYRDTSVVNDWLQENINVSLTNSDTTIATHQILYTTGDVLENIAPPSATLVQNHKNRLWIAGLEDPNQLWYSKEFVSGEGVAFNDGQIVQCDPRGGPITALGVLDDKLIIFKRDHIFALSGEGPLATGAQNDYGNPSLVSSDGGCVQPESVVITPMGLMYKSGKGIYLLDRALKPSYIGAAVEDFNTLTVTSAVLIEDFNEVRFTTSDGNALIYNYFFDQWSTFTNYESIAAISWLGSYYHLRSDGVVRQETVGEYLDAGGRIKMAIETSWLAFRQLQGYQRIYRYEFLGDFISDHTTRIKLAYDYEEAFKETVYFNVAEGLDLSYYGDDAVYGDSTVYGGSGTGVYQFSSKPRQQKCEAIKFRIEDLDNKTLAGGASFNLVGLTLEVGMKNTVNKLSGGQRIGSL